MAGSSFKPPESTTPEPSPGPEPAAVPPITLRQSQPPDGGESPRRGRFQFSLRTLLLVTTGVSILASLVAWLEIVLFMALMMLAGLILVFAGTYCLDNRVILVGGIMMFIASALSPFMLFFARL